MVYLCGLFLRVAWVSLVSLVFKALRRALRQRRMRSWTEEHGGYPDEVLEPFHQSDEVRRSMAVNTGLRSSSNMVIAGGVANIVVELAQMFWPEFVLSPEMRVNLTLAIAWVASRFTKTPAEPKVV